MKRKQNEDIYMKTITTTVWFLDTPAEVIIILNSKQQKYVTVAAAAAEAAVYHTNSTH